MNKKIALIFGITGQDGSYLAEFLIKKGYEVHGIVRRVALEDENHRLWRIRKILKDITIHAASLESYASIINIMIHLSMFYSKPCPYGQPPMCMGAHLQRKMVSL